MPQVSFFLQDCKVRLRLLVSDSSFPNWVGRILNAYSKVPQKSKVATSKRIASYQALALLFPLHLTGE
ncbi:hypothetical protein WN943_025953 [Citrus x changshan-huyou]